MPAATSSSPFEDAKAKLNLTPQEQSLYQMHLDNLWGSGGVDHPDGSRSTLYAGIEEHEGKYYTIPTVWNGKVETEPFTRPDGSTLDIANSTAMANVQKAGWDTFPSYATPGEADERYSAMHEYMNTDTSYYMHSAGLDDPR